MVNGTYPTTCNICTLTPNILNDNIYIKYVSIKTNYVS